MEQMFYAFFTSALEDSASLNLIQINMSKTTNNII
jgi:hypothetical protein